MQVIIVFGYNRTVSIYPAYDPQCKILVPFTILSSLWNEINSFCPVQGFVYVEGTKLQLCIVFWLSVKCSHTLNKKIM